MDGALRIVVQASRGPHAVENDGTIGYFCPGSQKNQGETAALTALQKVTGAVLKRGLLPLRMTVNTLV